MVGCCSWRRRRGAVIGGESSSDEREEFDKTPHALLTPTLTAHQYIELQEQSRGLVDRESYALLRSAEVDDDEYRNWTQETLTLLREGTDESVADTLRTPIRRGAPDEYKRSVIFRASATTGIYQKHTHEFLKILERRVFGNNVPKVFEGELPTFTYGFLGPEKELHQKARDDTVFIQVDLGPYSHTHQTAMPWNSANHSVVAGTISRLGSFTMHRLHPSMSLLRQSDDLQGTTHHRVESTMGPLPGTDHGIQRTTSFTDMHGHLPNRITRTDSDTQLLDALPRVSQDLVGHPSLRHLISSGNGLDRSGSLLKPTHVAEQPGLSTSHGGAHHPSISVTPEFRRLLSSMRNVRPQQNCTTRRASCEVHFANVHTLEGSTDYAGYLTERGKYIAAKLMWVINGNYPQVEFAPVLAPLICVLLFYVDEREALATVTYVLERSLEKLKSKSPRAFMTLRRSEFVRLVKQAVAITEKNLSRLFIHMELLGVDLAAWLARGLQDGFSRIVPFDLLVRMYMTFLYDGVKAFLRYGIAMLLMAEDRLLQCVSADEANHVLLFRELRSCQPHHLNELTKLAYSTRVKHTRHSLSNYEASGELPTPYLQKTDGVPRYYRPRIYDQSEILTDPLWIKIWRCLPNHTRILDPYLKFTTSKDGYSINGMFRCLWNYSDLPMVAAILTSARDIIVMHAPVTFRPDFKSVMQSLDVSGTFIASTLAGGKNLEVYPHHGSGRRIMIMTNSHICFGDPQILRIDNNLSKGQSVASDRTPVVVANKFGDFSITVMEVWVLE